MVPGTVHHHVQVVVCKPVHFLIMDDNCSDIETTTLWSCQGPRAGFQCLRQKMLAVKDLSNIWVPQSCLHALVMQAQMSMEAIKIARSGMAIAAAVKTWLAMEDLEDRFLHGSQG